MCNKYFEFLKVSQQVLAPHFVGHLSYWPDYLCCGWAKILGSYTEPKHQGVLGDQIRVY